MPSSNEISCWVEKNLPHAKEINIILSIENLPHVR